MKKFSLQFFTAFGSGGSARVKAVKIFLLAFIFCYTGYRSSAQVVVTPASGGTLVCYTSSTIGSAPSCTTLGTITVTESVSFDFANGNDDITLMPPPGWQFCTGSTPTITAAAGGDLFTAGPFAPQVVAFSAGSITVQFTAGGIANPDQITITGLQVQPTTTTAPMPPSYVYANASTGVSGLITGPAGTDFADLSEIRSDVIAGFSTLCTGETENYQNPSAFIPGGTWSSSNTTVATVDASGNVTAKTAGATTICYKLAGCQSCLIVTVKKTPSHSIGVHDMCAWIDSMWVKNPDSALGCGVFTSGLVSGGPGTVTVFGTLCTGHAIVKANAPGVDYITYRIGSCFVNDTFNVNPLPNPIVGNDTVCAGSTTLLSDGLTGGKWTSGNTLVATIDSVSGLVTGVAFGISHIKYTLPTGCYTDTVVFVNPLPVISGSANLCLGQNSTLSGSISSGKWTSSDTTIVKINGGGVVSSIAIGTAVITYTLPTGCMDTMAVTVNPLPSPIMGTAGAECVGDSVIVVSDATGGGVWSITNGNATLSGTLSVYGVTGGMDTIYYTLPTGCAEMYTVTINPLPVAITGPDSLCVGQVVKYTSGPGAGSWSSSDPSVLFIDPTGTATGLTAGTSMITFSFPTGCYVTKTVTVNPLPTISGPSIVCVASVIGLSSAPPLGTWTSSNTAIAKVNFAGNVTGIAPGTCLISYTISTGCTASMIVTVTARPGITPDDTVCVGQTITVSNITTGGVWTSTDTTIATIDPVTGLVTGIASGTVLMSYTMSPGCDISFLITVNPLAPITGPYTVCQTDSIMLSDAVPGGTWSSGNPGVASVSPGPTSGDTYVVGVSSGTAIITYTTSTGCQATYIVTVYPLAPITGFSALCVGTSDTLFNSLSPAGIWLSSNTSIATIDSATGIVNGLASGTVLIDYLMPTGCIAQKLITINPIPDTISGPTPRTICQGYTTIFSNTFPGGIGMWSLAAPSKGIINPSTGDYTAVLPGLDTIHYTLPTGCFVTDTIRIYPLTNIIMPADSMCVGDFMMLSDKTPGGKWSISDPSVATIDSVTGRLDGVGAGTAIITYLLPTGCEAVDTIKVNPLPDGISGTDSACVGAYTTFSDLPLGGRWTSSNTSIASVDSISGDILGVSAGTATITYKLPTGCYTTRDVRINPVPSAILGNYYVCIGFSTTLSETTPGGTWTNKNTMIDTIGNLSGIVTSLSPGVDTIFYILTKTGCQASASFTVFAQPTITITAPPMICRGGNITLTASGAEEGTITGIYAWDPTYALTPPVGPVVVASPTITTTYTVVGTTPIHGCKDTVTVTVPVDTLLNHIKVVGRDSICIGDTAMLSASGRDGSSFAWTPPIGLNCTICDTTVAQPTQTITYVATAIDRWGCKDSVLHKVTVMPRPKLSAVAEPDIFPITLCRGTPLQLLAFGAWGYVWSPNLFLSCDSCANPIATDTFNMQYLLTGYTKFGCFDSIRVNVSVLDTNINFVSPDTNICVGTSAHLMATSHSTYSNLDIPTYMWYPAYGLNDPTSSHPVATPDVTTTYTLVITENACFRDTVPVTVFVQPYPVIQLTPPAKQVYTGTEIQLNTTVTNTLVKSYLWTPGGSVSCDTCANPKVIPGAQTQYTVAVTSIYGCTSYDTVTFKSGCNSEQVYIPNSFTPNGDGMNDRFYISGKGLKTINMFSIYNRWGQLVYQVENINSNDPAAGWDGTYKGEVLPPDVYMYVIKATCEMGGDPFNYKGDVSLVR